MIAQGDFRKLLLADTEERSNIFRKLFHTDIYKVIQEKLKFEAGGLDKAYKELLRSIRQYTEQVRYSTENQLGQQWLLMEKNGFEGNLEEGLEILEQFLKADKDNLKAVNKQIKENDTELEKVNQLLGKNKSRCKARKENSFCKRRIILTVGTGTKDAENGAKEPEGDPTPDTFHTERKKRIRSVIQIWKICREIENVSKQIEKLAIDSIALQNRQKEKKTVLEQNKKNIRQQRNCGERKKAETDFERENRYSLR